jgi:hypothetical protein
VQTLRQPLSKVEPFDSKFTSLGAVAMLVCQAQRERFDVVSGGAPDSELPCSRSRRRSAQ